MDYTSNLYNLIRSRAGSKMLRQAESINMYNQVSDYLDDSQIDAAIQLYRKFEENYPIGTELHMGSIWFHEIETIDEKELEMLPWVYVHMLEALTGHNIASANLLAHKLAASPASEWRVPLPENLAPADAFTHIYEEWLDANRWIESFTLLATAENFSEVYESSTDYDAEEYDSDPHSEG